MRKSGFKMRSEHMREMEEYMEEQKRKEDSFWEGVIDLGRAALDIFLVYKKPPKV